MFTQRPPPLPRSLTDDSLGNNGFASGSFDADSSSTVLTSPTPFSMEAGGAAHTLVLRFPGTSCVYTFEVRGGGGHA